MFIYGIGEFLFRLREKKKLTQNELSFGICNFRELSKIEQGERLPNTFLLDTLMSRLGKSSDRLEYVVSEESYAFYEFRYKIEEAIEFGNVEKVKKNVEIYKSKLKIKDNLHFQYLDMIEALLSWENESECIQYLEKALNRTMEFSEEDCFNHVMSCLEAGILVLWARKKKRGEELSIFLEKMLFYAEKQWDDVEERVKIYPYIIKILSEELKEQKRYQELKRICGRGIYLLIKNNTMANLIELMELEILSMEQLGEKEEVINQKREQKRYLGEVCYEKNYRGRKFGLLSRMKREFYLDWEIIKKQRVAMGITQEKLCEDICTQESLARIEQGRRPHNKNYNRLTQKLLWKKEKRTNTINVWDYNLLELKSEINNDISKHRYQIAKEKLMEFRFQGTLESLQYLTYMKAVLEMQLEKIREKEAIEIFRKALFLTLNTENFEKLPNLILTRQEVVILNGIAIAYAKMGERKKAIELYGKILKSYENSKIALPFRSGGVSIILANMAGYLEEGERFDEALQVFEKAMEIAFKCGDLNDIAGLLTNAAYTLERKGEEEKGKEIFLQAYFISDLMKSEKIKEIIREHYEKVYMEKIGIKDVGKVIFKYVK